jgi:succinoglycan biosynthesis transport protein ExoP
MARRAVLASLLVAVAVGVASLLQTPKYEASAQVWVDQKQGPQQTNLAVSGEEIQTERLPQIRIDIPEHRERLHELIPVMPYAIDSRPVAEETIRRLGLRMEPAELLDKPTVEQVENTRFILLSYKGTDPVQAKQIANTAGEVSTELISERSAAGSQVRATVYEEAALPHTPVSPNPLKNGLLTLVVGLALSVGLMAGRGVLRR